MRNDVSLRAGRFLRREDIFAETLKRRNDDGNRPCSNHDDGRAVPFFIPSAG